MRPFILALLLGGCTSVVPATLLHLSAITPLNADPAAMAVALDLPEGIDIRPGTARLELAATRSDTGRSLNGVFVLERGDGLHPSYGIAAADVGRMRALQGQIATWKDAAPDATHGSLRVGLSPCRRGDGPAVDARVSVAIRLQPDGEFMPLVRNGPLSAVVDATDLRDMALCPAPAAGFH